MNCDIEFKVNNAHLDDIIEMIKQLLERTAITEVKISAIFDE